MLLDFSFGFVYGAIFMATISLATLVSNSFVRKLDPSDEVKWSGIPSPGIFVLRMGILPALVCFLEVCDYWRNNRDVVPTLGWLLLTFIFFALVIAPHIARVADRSISLDLWCTFERVGIPVLVAGISAASFVSLALLSPASLHTARWAWVHLIALSWVSSTTFLGIEYAVWLTRRR